MSTGCCCCSSPVVSISSSRKLSTKNLDFAARTQIRAVGLGNYVSGRRWIRPCVVVKASAVDSYESSSNFINRMERAWLISQQPRPVACASCDSNGHVDCPWCNGTGFFILGDNMLCQVPSKNTTCIICAGKVTN
ncbi:OLC1v1030491C2 [Oldenlandia corymbosa var. corymbosa]|uniref:OLC1v1030491C2 n=1 Tax=Oldenlandia corymbosa var. corymbosa TaxID=529605 RepID=A0AAV1CG30_OLDCO|nr:OLC1v1030491C2 [Oldenlandia corymbosa var. corymbosa]